TVRRDRDDDSLLRPRQARKGVSGDRMIAERAGELLVLRVVQKDEAPAVESVGSVLGLEVRVWSWEQQHSYGHRADPRDDHAPAHRSQLATRNFYGSPPSCAVFNASAQRFPHGLNLFA